MDARLILVALASRTASLFSSGILIPSFVCRVSVWLLAALKAVQQRAGELRGSLLKYLFTLTGGDAVAGGQALGFCARLARCAGLCWLSCSVAAVLCARRSVLTRVCLLCCAAETLLLHLVSRV
jgi:hypothetical protein